MGAPPFFAPFLQVVLVISLTKISPSNCCPIRSFSCRPGDINFTPPIIESCGSHNFKCENSTLHIQFHGRGKWYPTDSIKYPESTLTVRDTWLGEKLGQTHCHILYKFKSPIPNFEVGEIDPRMLFDCNFDSYNFSRDFFYRNYRRANCGDYDLYYSHYRQTLEGLPANCTTPSDGWAVAVEWVLNFQDYGDNNSVVNFSLQSVGFSPHRRAVADCFDCKIRSGNCTAVRPENSSCTCRHLPCPHGSNDKKLNIWLPLGVVGFVIVLISLFSLTIFCRRKYRTSSTLKCISKEKSVEAFLKRQLITLAVKQYRYAQVKKMTTDFKEQLGQGGYGTVYKGKLSDGSLVAVKILRQTNGSGEEEFINEVCSIGGTNHINVVTLLGFCSEGSRRALVYEFMPNGSLDKFLFADDVKIKTFLDWEKLQNIAIGIASGLEYLHRGCKTPMVHFDVKPHNILLDEDLCPKISDFGLARFYKPKESILSSMACARGTIGYIAPEVFSRNFGTVSSKSDVYSYGMMVLEMVGRRKNVVNRAQNTSEVYFPHWIYEHLDEYCHGLQETVCPADSIEGENPEIARKMALVGLWCIQTSPSSRPSISKVVEMLKGDAGNLAIPPKPYICSPERSGRCNNIQDIATFTCSSSE